MVPVSAVMAMVVMSTVFVVMAVVFTVMTTLVVTVIASFGNSGYGEAGCEGQVKKTWGHVLHHAFESRSDRITREEES